MIVECEVCKKGIPEVAILHRVNEKGVPGIWRCENCMTSEQAEDINPVALAIVEDQIRRDSQA